MNRLRSYRGIENITQEELGKRLGISKELVSGIESGRRSPTCDLRRIGYAPERIPVAEMTEPLHRQRASTRAAAQRRAKELMRLAGEVALELRPKRRRSIRLERLGPLRSDDDIAEVADDVRVGILDQEEAAPIRNLSAAVERAGVCLVPLVDLPGIDGISTWVEQQQPVIGMNVDVPGERFRLSLAHEIAHLVLHTKRTDTTEDEAYRFASALLIPDDEFEAAMSGIRLSIRDFLGLKSSWGVSVKALVYRAHATGHLNDRTYRSMQIQMSKWRNKEPASIPIVPGTLLADLMREHGGYRACAANLGFDLDHLRLLTNWRQRHLSIAAASSA